MLDHNNPALFALDGYLLCLARLCGPQYAFAAAAYEAQSDIDEFGASLVERLNERMESLSARKLAYFGKAEISYEQLHKEMASYLFNGRLAREAAPDEVTYRDTEAMVIWDVEEYFGLASTHLNTKGVFHPLVTGPVFHLDIRNDVEERSFYFLVRIEHIYVVTSLRKKSEAP